MIILADRLAHRGWTGVGSGAAVRGSLSGERGRCAPRCAPRADGGSVTRPAVAVREATLTTSRPCWGCGPSCATSAAGWSGLIPGPDDAALRQRLAAVADDPDSCALVATVDGEVAGMVAAHRDRLRAAVRPARRARALPARPGRLPAAGRREGAAGAAVELSPTRWAPSTSSPACCRRCARPSGSTPGSASARSSSAGRRRSASCAGGSHRQGAATVDRQPAGPPAVAAPGAGRGGPRQRLITPYAVRRPGRRRGAGR